MHILPAQTEHIPRVVSVLQRGGIIVYPTETVYGLGCLADDAAAIKRIAALKGSAEQVSFLVLVRDLEQALDYAAALLPDARALARKFWPGPLTLVLPAHPHLPDLIVGPSGGVGLRVSPHPWVKALLRSLSSGLVSTSANPHGWPAPDSLAELDQRLGDKADLVLDGGTLPGTPSTVLDLCGEKPVLVREGAIEKEEIEALIGKLD